LCFIISDEKCIALHIGGFVYANLHNHVLHIYMYTHTDIYGYVHTQKDRKRETEAYDNIAELLKRLRGKNTSQA